MPPKMHTTEALGSPMGGGTSPAGTDTFHPSETEGFLFDQGTASQDYADCLQKIAGVAALVLERRHTIGPDNENNTQREHHYVSLPINGFDHNGWFTRAEPELDSGVTLVIKPGLGEIVNDGIGWELHKQLTHLLPGFDVFSHETDGVGHFARHMGWHDLLNHGLDQMAEQGLELMGELCPDRRIVTLGTSMGTVIFNKLLNLNTSQNKPVEIVGAVNYAPALVDPRNVPIDMLVRFLPELVTGGAEEMLSLLQDPGRFVGLLRTLVKSKPSTSNLLPMARQVYDLVHGTPEEEVQQALEHYPTLVIAGTRGAVEQIRMWRRLSGTTPNLTFLPVPGHGHAMALNPHKGAPKIAKSIVHRGLHSAAA